MNNGEALTTDIGEEASAGAPSTGGAPTDQAEMGGESSSGAQAGGAANGGGDNSQAGADDGDNNGEAGADNGGDNNGEAGADNGGDNNGEAGADNGGDDNGEAGAGGDAMELDCNAPMPSTGAQPHSGNGRGGTDNLAWEIWSNTGMGEMTTYDVPAFTASWNEAGGYLGRVGYEWGNNAQPYESHGTITAEFSSIKSGSAGGYSYIGMYGWSTGPCVEWYIVDDSYNTMPINPGGTTNMGEVEIDGGTYIMYTRPTTGSGGTRCTGENDWIQYYSVRKTARQCGQISLTAHFDAWKELGMDLGNLLEAKIIVEVGGGSGKVDLPVANVKKTQ